MLARFGDLRQVDNLKVGRKPALIVAFMLAFGSMILSYNDAHAAPCTIPNPLNNGQIADASQVMGDLNSILACIAATATPTGSPVAGNLTKFSGPTSITNGDLSGDVSTSGSLVTTIGAGKVTEPMQGLSDTTTGNVSISRHGYAPKAPNDATKYLDGTGAWTVPAGGGGGGGTTNNYYAGALQLIGTCTPSGTSTCTFSSIPQGYTNLRIVGAARSATSATTDDVKIWFNGDTTAANYGSQQVQGASSSASAAANPAVNNYAFAVSGATAAAGQAGTVEMTLPLYSATSFVKGWQSVNGLPGYPLVKAATGRWNATTAISQIDLVLISGSTFASGSTFYLYGEGGSNVTVNPQPGLPVISETVTSGSQSSVTVSGIPSTYRDIKIVISGRGTTAATSVIVSLQINGDTGNNYNVVTYNTNGSTALSAASGTLRSSIELGRLTAASSTANYSGLIEATLSNYASTTFNKVTSALGNAYYGSTVSQIVGWEGGAWNSTAAVTSIKVFPTAGAFADGTVVTVYGIGGSPTATLPVVPPQGRLTLTSNTPVMTADATAQTSIFYAPYVGSLLPVGNVMYRFSQLSYVLNSTAHASGSLYDIGAYNNAGAIVLCTAPAWTNSTTRAAAIAQDATNAIWTNSASLTCNLSGGTTTTTIAAGQWTYLGTFYATANGQTGMAFNPSAAAGGSNNMLGLWNAYNRVTITARSRASDASCTYAVTTWRGTCNSASNRVSYVDGLGQSFIRSRATVLADIPSGSYAGIGVNRDSTSATPSVACNAGGGAGQWGLNCADEFTPALGFHYIQGMEIRAAGSGTITFYESGYQSVAVNIEMLLLPFGFTRRRRKAANDNADVSRRAA